MFFIRWGVLAASLWIAVQLVGGIDMTGGFWSYIWLALVFGLVNAVIGTVVKIVSFPLILLSLGLFTFVVNAFMLEITDALVDSFVVDGFGSALFGAIIVSVAQMALMGLVRRLG